ELADPRHDAERRPAHVPDVDGDVAPGDEPLPLLLDGRLDRVYVVAEERADAVLAGRGEDAAELGPEEGVGDLDEDARPVARVLVGPGGTAVLEVGERRERPLDGLVAPPPVRPHDEGHAAGIVLERGVVEAGWSRVRQERLRREGVPPCVWLVGGGGRVGRLARWGARAKDERNRLQKARRALHRT